MALIQYDATPDAFTYEVVRGAGSSIGTVGVRVTVDTVNALNKQTVEQLLRAILAKITQDNWPAQ